MSVMVKVILLFDAILRHQLFHGHVAFAFHLANGSNAGFNARLRLAG
jgi:hypothetical protein